MSRIIFSRLNLVLLATMACVTIVGFWLLPSDQQLPLHWNWYGVVDAWGSRPRALLLLPMAAVTWTIFFWTLDRWVLHLDDSHGGRQYAVGLSSQLALFLVLQMMLIGHGLGYPVDVSRASAFVAALSFIALGNLLPKMQANTSGFNWPKSLDASEHRRVRRLTGGMMMVSGVGLLIASVFGVPAPWLNSGILLTALMPVVAGIAYALLLSSARAT
jgi:uncharacterized membrane protein